MKMNEIIVNLWHKGRYYTGQVQMIIDKHLLFWLAGQVAVGLLAAFFLAFGIGTLCGAYSLTNPHEFIMYFFSSSLMILVSGVLLLSPMINIYKCFTSFHGKKEKKEILPDEQDTTGKDQETSR